jgi:hypothetical protein
MIVVGLALSLFVIGFLCWLLFTLAVNATPIFVGVTAAFAAFNYGAGVTGALIVGLTASVVTLVASRAAFSVAKSPIVRGAFALVFAAPAAVAGFHATLGLARISLPSEIGVIFSLSSAPFSSAAPRSFVWRARRALSRMSGALLSSMPRHGHHRGLGREGLTSAISIVRLAVTRWRRSRPLNTHEGIGRGALLDVFAKVWPPTMT